MSDLAERLRHTASKGVSVWGDLMMEAAQEIDALRAALAQPEQEPVAWKVVEGTGVSYLSSEPPHPSVVAACRPLYTAPAHQRKPLTDDQIAEICMDCSLVTPSDIYFARAIEAAHGIGGDHD